MTTHNPDQADDQVDETPELLQFRVQVGHEKIVVRGSDRAAALHEARRRLCLELPRMWDVIEKMEDSRFVIEELT